MLIALLACTAKPVPGPTAARPVPTAGPTQEYVVRFGDTLFWIASRFGVPGGISQIAADNDVYDPHYILAGERLELNGIAHPDLSPFPVYADVDEDLKACDAAVQEDVMGWAGVPSSFCASGLTIVQAQLDRDQPEEVLAGCLIEDTGVGMTTWKVALVDGPAMTTQFQLANFGEGSVVEGPMGCEILGTSWDAVPVELSTSWHLVGRRYRLNAGELSVASRELRTRRLLYSYEPGDPAQDLSHKHAKVRNIEPALQGERVVSGSAVMGRGLELDLGYGMSADPMLRFGDASTRVLYPAGYLPRGLEGRTVSYETLRTGVWGQSQTVIWL